MNCFEDCVMKMRVLKLPSEVLLKCLQGKADLGVELPVDVELLDLKFDLVLGQVVAVVRSESFEDTTESHPISEFKAAQKTSIKPAAAKPVQKPRLTTPTRVARVEPKPVKQEHTLPDLDTNAVKEEFTPEQQELLSFQAQDDYVLIKPTQYLKAEWDELNDIVKSLGGKWVKGSIISYWAVPMHQD
ncbi:MAG: hypothetical protein NWF04_07340 [Candidatus Bathyarchaeota archaeon]|nr:hypothetical protein [Candidatus Bathyarchaeota archaeon]